MGWLLDFTYTVAGLYGAVNLYIRYGTPLTVPPPWSQGVLSPPVISATSHQCVITAVQVDVSVSGDGKHRPYNGRSVCCLYAQAEPDHNSKSCRRGRSRVRVFRREPQAGRATP
jgi:hypothetical protein